MSESTRPVGSKGILFDHLILFEDEAKKKGDLKKKKTDFILMKR